jgi:multicomponent Na+:H+ antiporter subunit C
VNTTNLALSLVVGVLFAGGTYLLLERVLLRSILGFVLLGHGANLVLIMSGGPAAGFPFADENKPGESADPLPQAMALTAVVITFAITALLLALADRSVAMHGDDQVQDDLEDRMVERQETATEEEL